VGWGWGGIICALFFFLAMAVFFWLNLASWLFFKMCLFSLVITLKKFGVGGGEINPNFSIWF